MLGDWEVLRIASIHALEHRSWVELAVPGRVGSVFQDLNTTPTRIAIRGSLQKEEERDEFIEQVREKFRAGEPVTFALTATVDDVQRPGGATREHLALMRSGTPGQRSPQCHRHRRSIVHCSPS